MTALYRFREFEASQQETLERAVAAHQAYLSALRAMRPLKGGMHWKKIRGKEYLYKYRDRRGNGESLGPRSPETESRLAAYQRERREATALLASRREHLATAARFCRAALIHRVPAAVIRILRRLELSGLAGTLTVLGTEALHAYEFAAGAFMEGAKAARFWADGVGKLTLASAAAVAPEELLALLRQADRSFQALDGGGFRAVNKAGFVVRWLQPPVLRTQDRAGRFDAAKPAVPATAGDLSALVNSPKFSQVVIGTRGDMATLVAPDPRAMALHKLWLSQQEDRAPESRSRDRLQAMALAELILRFLPQYDFFSSQLQLFPSEVVRQAQELGEDYGLSPDLDLGIETEA